MRILHLSLMLIWCLSSKFIGRHSASATLLNIISRRTQNSSAPSTQNFINRNYHAAIEGGGYLYIDGGDVSYFDQNGIFQHVPDNNTYAIDLSKDWTNETVVFNAIPKAAPVLCFSHLWADRSNNVIYSFGGEQCRSLPLDESPPIPPTQLWQFTPYGTSGLWKEVAGIQGLSDITRPAGASSAFGGGQAFLLGGYSTSRTSSETNHVLGNQPLPGILTYDFTRNAFTNNSATSFNTYGTSEFGEMQYININNGKHGLVAAFGGDYSTTTSWKDNGWKLQTFGKIHMYNPDSKTWYNQTASGTIPERRDRFCATGVQGDNGTYEIFIFGGHVPSSSGYPEASVTIADQARNILRDEVFVLTIPGFNWQKAKYSPRWPRMGHTCNVVGNRQMAIVGGLNPSANSKSKLLSQQDPWANGIGIFDLTEMRWKSKYEAQAASYVTPQAVKSWYKRNGGPYPHTWDDPGLEVYFTGNQVTTTPAPLPSTASSPGSSSSAAAAPSNSSTGAIIGGVVGGIGGALIIIAALLFLLRRRGQTGGPEDAFSLHSRDDQAEVSPAKDEKPLATELPATSKGSIAELSGDLKIPWSEASTLRSPISPLVEAPNRNGRIELAA